jgi:hypothetical protein
MNMPRGPRAAGFTRAILVRFEEVPASCRPLGRVDVAVIGVAVRAVIRPLAIATDTSSAGHSATIAARTVARAMWQVSRAESGRRGPGGHRGTLRRCLHMSGAQRQQAINYLPWPKEKNQSVVGRAKASRATFISAQEIGARIRGATSP